MIKNRLRFIHFRREKHRKAVDGEFYQVPSPDFTAVRHKNNTWLIGHTYLRAGA